MAARLLETYAQMFGKPPREWAFPPLNYLTRIYPLGFEQEHTAQLQVRSPLRVGRMAVSA